MINKSFKHIIIWSIISLIPTTAFAIAQSATSEETVKISKTISYKKNNSLNDKTKKNMLEEAPKDITSSKLQNKLSIGLITTAHHVSFDYSIYDATTDLISDMDYDGFYHRFAVTIDVDTLFNHSNVYADFYLSYEGGPWIYYASSNHYDIHSDSADDAFIIETELADGYPTGYYDMRIKLYDSDSDEYLLTYDYSNDASLLSIPLEDSYRDKGYNDSSVETEFFVSHGAGSINFLSLFLLCALLVARQINTIFCNKHTHEALK